MSLAASRHLSISLSNESVQNRWVSRAATGSKYPAKGASIGAVIDSDDRLDTARPLYWHAVMNHPNRLVMLCDRARVLTAAITLKQSRSKQAQAVGPPVLDRRRPQRRVPFPNPATDNVHGNVPRPVTFPADITDWIASLLCQKGFQVGPGVNLR
jgi:hypothetical protein